ncbi:hypothetical protein SMKI_12G1060 [Saccharomyces mikatae IFO 1815]|uniref:Uncharacterized protein n=1 Tax=Saccharomyces mikatae IFO 1815 TaxID=226126 RepID=A0AA35ISA3_SACMI|nr:uncharacterized protein SMKI_12G1060 [Saccharomyces mikatae IFO 1815]CAI4034969.1 hypothetical protein SMKI_12G1060 [Saccharomyces mikatae IFO 1815]
MEGEQIVEYVQETPIIPRRVIQYSVPKKKITMPSPCVKMSQAVNNLQDMNLPQHPSLRDSSLDKEYSTQRFLGGINERRLSFEEHRNEQHQNPIGLIKRVGTFFKKRSSSGKSSIKSIGDVKTDGSNLIEGYLSENDDPIEQLVQKNLFDEHKGNSEENDKRHGLFSFEETPPIQVLERTYPNPVDSSFENVPLTEERRFSENPRSLEPSEYEHSLSEPIPFRSSTGGENQRGVRGHTDIAAHNLRVASIKEKKKILEMEQNRLITEIIRLENILNKHRKIDVNSSTGKSENKSSEKDSITFVNSTAPNTAVLKQRTSSSDHNVNFLHNDVSDIPDTFDLEEPYDPLKDKWTTLQSLEKCFESKFQSVSNSKKGDELATIKERNFQVAKINNICFRVQESIKKRQDLEAKLRNLSHDTDNELLFLMMENKRRQKSSVIIQFLSDIINEKSKRFTAEEQGFVNENEVKPLISDLSEGINRLNSILEMKNTCIRRLSNQ